MAENTIQIIAEYIQKNEDALKEFREDLQGLGEDTDQVSEKAKRSSDESDRQNLSMTNLFSAVGLVKEGWQLLNSVYDETIAKTLEQGNVIRELRDVTGGSSEEISRAVQVLDDYKISSESLLTAQKFLAKEGLSLNITTLAKLSDQYLKLGSVQERSKFLTDNLGKSGLAYAEILGKGSAAIIAQGDAVAKGLVFNDRQLAQMRELEIHQDTVTDNWTAMKNEMSMAVLPALDAITTSLVDNAAASDITAAKIEELGLKGNDARLFAMQYTDTAKAQAAAQREVADAAMIENEAVTNLSDSTEELAAATEAASAANQGLLGVMQNVSSENASYIQKQEEVKAKQAELQTQIQELLAGGWSPLSEKVKELQSDYDTLGLKYQQNAEQHRAAMNKINFDLLLTKLNVGGLTDAEFLMAQQAGLAFGQLDQEAIDTARNFDLVAQAVADGKIRVEDMADAINLLPSLKTIDIVIQTLMTTVEQNVTNSGSANYVQQLNNRGFQHGGISRGPQSGHMELLHGDEAVIPLQNGSVPVSLSGGMGGSNITVQLLIQSPITILDQQQGQQAMLSFIEYGVKTLQERGVLPQ